MMNISVILPTTKLFGGVKRFIELGNRFIDSQHNFSIYTPHGKKPDWCEFKGKVNRIDNINEKKHDVIFFTEERFSDAVLKTEAKKKIFYHVLKSVDLKKILTHPEIEIFVNSSELYEYDKKRYGITPFKALGGIDTGSFRKACKKERKTDSFRILTYGRLSRKKKGTMLVVKACEKLYKKYPHVKLLLFDSPVDDKSRKMISDFSCNMPFEFIVNHPVEKNFEIYRKADIFVSAERNAGWANTCAEAMASKTAVIATDSGTSDFLIHNKTGIKVLRNSFFIKRAILKLMCDRQKLEALAENGHKIIQQFDWDSLCKRILDRLETKV